MVRLSDTAKGKKPVFITEITKKLIGSLLGKFDLSHTAVTSGIFPTIFREKVHKFLRILNASKRKHTYLTNEKWWFDETSYNSTKWETLIPTRIETEISRSSECLQLYVSYFSYQSTYRTYRLHSTSIFLITEQFNVSTFFAACFVRAGMYIYWWLKRRIVIKITRSLSLTT